jgi:arsenate reductase (thioredoxin)
LTKVLFVCIGNACRSQMAEGFARAYGGDVLVPASAGLAPASRLASDTVLAMEEKNIDVSQHFPKAVRHLHRVKFDLVVNMTGVGAPIAVQAPVRIWSIPDPVSLSYEDHCAVRDEIERKVMELVLELRRATQPAAGEPPASAQSQ